MATLYIYKRFISLENPFSHIGEQVGIVTGKSESACIRSVRNSERLKHTYMNDNFVYSWTPLK